MAKATLPERAVRPSHRRTPLGGGGIDDARLSAILARKANRLALLGDREKAALLLAAARILTPPDGRAEARDGPVSEGDDPSRPSARTLVPTLFRHAVERSKAGDRVAAEALYRGILVLDARFAMVWSNLAALLVDDGRLDAALAAGREALALEPGLLNAQLNLAKVYQRRAMTSDLVAILRSVTERHPHRFDLLRSLAEAFTRAARPEEALAVHDRVVVADPDDVDSLFAKADVLKTLGRIEDAIACLGAVTGLRPDHAVALSNRGILMALHSLSNDLDEAASLCLRGAMLEPGNAGILNNLAVVLQIRGDTENALLVLRQLVAQDPGFAPAYSNIGSLLAQKAFYDEAEDAFLRALAIDPSLVEPRIEMTKVRRHLCDWSQSEADEATIRDLNGGTTNFLIAFMALSASGEEQLAYARRAMAKPASSPTRAGQHKNAFDPRRLRIGYLSGDFKEHPVGHLVPDLIALHDRARFDVIGYSLGADDGSTLRRRLAGLFDRFVDLDRTSDVAAATTILDDRIDILVDLTGPTANGRFGILSLRPAPIQVSFLGLPGTSGTDRIDYIIADRFLVPPGHERFYHERVVRLPGCYQPCDTARRTPDPRPSRTACGLPEWGFVFASFNNTMKISPEVFDTWMRVLGAVEGSVLWLYARTEKAKANMLDRARRRGIAGDRLIFAGAVPFASYLGRMTCADLFLDTFPYAAGATCNDALWIGLPVLTRVGETYVSRMGGSLLTALGMPDLVTETLGDYEREAIALARDPERMRALRERLARARATSALFDMPAFAASLETAYARMAREARSGRAPAAFDVGDEPVRWSSGT